MAVVQQRRAPLDLVLIVAFCAALLAPAADVLLRPGAIDDVHRELREPAPVPSFEPSFAALDLLPRQFDDWWSDRMGLRDVLLRLRSRAYVEVFGRSPTPNAVLGRDGWVFPTLMGIVDASRGTTKLWPARLELWRRALESQRAFCEEHGAEYVVAFAPEKSTIYPDLLPDGFDLRPPSALDQLIEWLRTHSDLRVLDLRPILRAEREHDEGGDLAYYPLGTHWTDRGMYAAYRALLEGPAARLPNLRPLELDALHWVEDAREGDSWAGNLRLEGRLHQRSRVLREVEGGYECEIGRPEAGDAQVSVAGPRADAPRLVFFHDSFGDRMRKLLARTFSASFFGWQAQLDPEVVLREHPDVVIDLHAERRLLIDRPTPVLRPGENPLIAAFAASAEVVFRWDAGAPPGALVPVGTTRIDATADGIVVEQRAGGDLVELAIGTLPRGRTSVLQVDLDSSRADVLDVLYRTVHVPRFRRGQVASAFVPAGRSTVYVEVDDSDAIGPLRVRFGRKPGTCVVRALELRLR